MAEVGAPTITLFGHPAYRSFRNLWMLEELQVPYTNIPCHPRSKEAASVNPFGKIPTLKDGSFVMYESAAINTYLGDRFRTDQLGPVLVPPAGTTERGRYEQLVSCIQTELDAQGLWIHRKHEALGKYFGSIPEAVAHAREHFKSALGVLLDELADSGGDYLLASGFSAADILLVHCITWASAVGWLPTSELSDDKNRTLARYLKRCTERPAHVRAAQLRNSSKM